MTHACCSQQWPPTWIQEPGYYFFPEKNGWYCFSNLICLLLMKWSCSFSMTSMLVAASQLHLQPCHSFYFFAFKPWARDRDIIFQRKMIAKLPYTIISITNVKAESSQHTFLLSNAILLKLQYFILIVLYFHIDTLFFLCRKCMKCLKAVTCSEMVAICDFISLSWV